MKVLLKIRYVIVFETDIREHKKYAEWQRKFYLPTYIYAFKVN